MTDTHQFTVRDQILIDAPIDRCFLLSTSIELVQRELHMQPIQGRTSGFIQNGDTILWRGWKFGLPQYHESIIEALEPNRFFRDRMLRGRFALFEHDHYFEPQPASATLLRDEIRFSMPWGTAGRAAGKRILLPYTRDVLHRRFQMLKQIAESPEWLHYLPGSYPRQG
jgi:ligand-binding SRPBCC domain-containing protein